MLDIFFPFVVEKKKVKPVDSQQVQLSFKAHWFENFHCSEKRLSKEYLGQKDKKVFLIVVDTCHPPTIWEI